MSLESRIHTKDEKRERKPRKSNAPQKGDSHRASFDLFRKGHPIKEIADLRKLAVSTIEGHLTRFVASGDIAVASLMSTEKYNKIESAISKADGYATAPIKQMLGEDVSFAEIRWVLAAKGLDRISSAD
jgi:uncharacterized protein YpbB